MRVSVYNQKGEKVSTALLPKEIFEIPMNYDLVHQVMISQMSNRRQGTAHTKTRAEVSGGGRKPWRQKGTGRARHGSIRSPIWIGGGVTFGPRREKKYKKRISKKMKRKALFMVLSAKAKENMIVVLNKLEAEKPKTKIMVKLLNNMANVTKEQKNKRTKEQISTLIALPKIDKNIILAGRNIPKINIMVAKDLNALNLLSFKYLILPKESLKVIKNTFLKSQ
jgi:large subunit ribosomal protein L4